VLQGGVHIKMSVRRFRYTVQLHWIIPDDIIQDGMIVVNSAAGLLKRNGDGVLTPHREYKVNSHLVGWSVRRRSNSKYHQGQCTHDE